MSDKALNKWKETTQTTDTQDNMMISHLLSTYLLHFILVQTVQGDVLFSQLRWLLKCVPEVKIKI